MFVARSPTLGRPLLLLSPSGTHCIATLAGLSDGETLPQTMFVLRMLLVANRLRHRQRHAEIVDRLQACSEDTRRQRGS